MWRVSFGERLRRLREDRNWSRDYVAQQLGSSYSSIAKYESGTRSPDPETISKLADLFNVSTDYLLGRVDTPTPLAELLSTKEADRLSSPILARIKTFAESLGVDYKEALNHADVTENDIRQLNPNEPDPHILWPVAQTLGTSMAYLTGLTDRTKPILGTGQALHDQSRLYRPADEIHPEDAWDLEQAYLRVRKIRAERKAREGHH